MEHHIINKETISKCYVVIYSIMQHHNGTIIDRRTMIKTQ